MFSTTRDSWLQVVGRTEIIIGAVAGILGLFSLFAGLRDPTDMAMLGIVGGPLIAALGTALLIAGWGLRQLPTPRVWLQALPVSVVLIVYGLFWLVS